MPPRDGHAQPAAPAAHAAPAGLMAMVVAIAGLLACVGAFVTILIGPVAVDDWVGWFAAVLALMFLVVLVTNRTTGVSARSAAEHARHAHIEAAGAAAVARGRMSVLETVVAGLPEGLLIVDAKGRVLFGNRTAGRFVDLDLLAEPIDWARRHGVNLDETGTVCPDGESPIVLALRGEHVDDREMFVRNRLIPDGSWLSITARPVKGNAGQEVTAAAVVLRDVSRKRRVAQALKEDRNLLEQRYRRQSALAEIERAIGGAHDIWPVLDQIAERARLLLPASGAFIVLNPDELPAAPDKPMATMDRSPGRLARDDPATCWILENRRPLAVHDLADDPFAARRDVGRMGVQAYAGVPLLADDKPLGVLFAVSAQRHAHTQDELDFMTSLANRAAAAVTRISLHDRITGLNRRLVRRTEQLKESEQRLRGLADTVPAMIWMAGADKRSTYFNKPWSDFTGRSLDTDVGCGWADVGIHDDDIDRCVQAYADHFDVREPFRLEYRLRRADGCYRWVLDTGTPQFSADGAFLGYIGSCIDITDRREAEQELEEQREELESLVEQRTAELTVTSERLRVADRLASLGTLAAGIGHDMNNVLFPVRCRLDALDWSTVPAEHGELLDTVRHSVQYLQQLTDGLRLFALDPDDTESADASTDVAAWWKQVEPLLTKAVPPTISVECELSDDLPAVRAAPHRLTQAVLNLVLNAGEASPSDALVRVTGSVDRERDEVVIAVCDRGVGMTPEVRRHALDPFFTTKKRSMSTGLGLSLVHGVVTASRGTVGIDSSPGRGTTITLRLPAAEDDEAATSAARATVSVSNTRNAAWIARLLRADGFQIRIGPKEPGDATLWITDPAPGARDRAAAFLAGDRRRRVIVFGEPGDEWSDVPAVIVEDTDNLEAVRDAVARGAAAAGATS